MDNFFVKIFNGILVIVSFIMFVLCVLWVYYSTLGKNKLPQVVDTVYIGTVHDKLNDVDKSAIEAQYFENKGGKGLEIVECRINYYADNIGSTIHSIGWQYDFTNNKLTEYVTDNQNVSEVNHGDPYYFNEHAQSLPFLINGDMYSIKLNGTYHYWQKGNATVGNFITNVWNFICGGGYSSDRNFVWTEKVGYYNAHDLLDSLRLGIGSLSSGYGKMTLPMVDFSKFFNVYDSQGHLVGRGDDKNSNVTRYNYFKIDTNRDRRGMEIASQSLFGIVDGDSNYNVTGLDPNVVYHNSNTVYNFTQANFDSRFSDTEQGYYYSFSADTINDLKGYDDIEVDITFDCSKMKGKTLGFDYFALFGLKVSSLTISADKQQDFLLLANSLKDTSLSLSSIHVKNINLIDKSSGADADVPPMRLNNMYIYYIDRFFNKRLCYE